MSFLRIGDRAAGAIKSGGTTRRAAKMVVPRRRPPRHRALHRLEGHRGAEGRRAGRRQQAVQPPPERSSSAPATSGDFPGDERFDPRKNNELRQRDPCRPRRRDARELRPARRRSSPVRATRGIEFEEYDTDWDSEAYGTVAGQNSNNSVRVPTSSCAPSRGDNTWD
jgi:ribonucleoside-diphosphate reductase alpha chain